MPAKLFAGADIPGQAWDDGTFLYELWDRKRGDRRAPTRADLSPMDLKRVLTQVTINDVEWQPFRLRSRLIGTGFADAVGFDPTGRYTDEFPNTEMLQRRARWVAETCVPLLSQGLQLIWSPKTFKSYDALCLPLLGPEDRVNMLLFIDRFHIA